MLYLILVSFVLLILVLLVRLTYPLHFIGQDKHLADQELHREKIGLAKGWIYTALISTVVMLLGLIYLAAQGTPYEAHLMEWLNIILRVLHITFGIAWIGASFYFVFLENSLNRTENLRDELAGNLWAVHGGGFYYLEKYKTAPKVIPKELHWFKYEAYFTWLSGFSLLFVVYYFNARSMLIDSNVLNISPLTAISLGIGSFVVAWVLYDRLCKTRLIYTGPWFALVGLVIAAAFAWFYIHVFNSRAAYIHFGAMLATIMVANVFFNIIPAQKAMVKAGKEGILPDPQLGRIAGLRSLHNNYFTMPVLFVMVSNHFPGTFGNNHSWIILLAITLGTAGIKHWLNLREKGQINAWVFPVSAIILLVAAFISAPQPATTECRSVDIAEVNEIVQRRCVQCHSANPTDDVFKTAPNGVIYNSPLDLIKLKDKVMLRVVLTKTMPQNNKTGMTQEERDAIACWLEKKN